MKKIYLITIYDPDEAQGMFDEGGKLLGYWFLNDANWRSEYFNGFMEEIGIEVTQANNSKTRYFEEKLIRELNEI